MNIGASDWDGEMGAVRVELLKKYYTNGDSFSLIAWKINRETGTVFTRGAISGKVDREGLTRERGRKKGQARQQKLTRMVLGSKKNGSWRNGPSLKAEPIPPPVVFTDAHKCTLFELKNNSCRFPLWDGDTPFHDKFFCGAPEADVDDDRPWCTFHSAVACRPVPVREAAE